MALLSEAEISQAVAVDIVDYCLEHGYPLQQKGNHYWFGVEHDSLVIDRSKNYFSWNSQGIKGNSIKFVQTFFNLSFRDAVKSLNEKNYQKMSEVVIEKPKEFVYDLEHDTNTAAVENYLVEERKIDQDIVEALIAKGLIKQDKKKNCVFVWGATGRRVGADLQGTITSKHLGKRMSFKQIKSNSEPNFGFNVSLGVPKAIYFFEAPIDLLSYWSMNKDLKNCRLISMNGLKEKTIMNMIKHTYLTRGTMPVQGIYLGIDNDKAAHKFMDKLRELKFQDKNGQEFQFENLIPDDRSIPREFIPIYQAAAQIYGFDWKWLAAIHKAETNLSDTNDIANNYQYGKFFGQVLKGGESPSLIDLKTTIHQCAHAIKDNIQKGKIDVTTLLYDEQVSYTNRKLMENKVNYYYDAYSDLGYLPSDFIAKDWNERLKENTEKQPVIEKEPAKRKGLEYSR
ncbi:DUF3991 and TOPRIM domain-containing protein [Bacillus sp. Au-Bac7]|uniref:DUF3991 and TOPRIM domain-containing protein n=1 Tax=Bacillus sp. Au-Bac7 TaxID=2906458 RepID=UPI001E3DC4E9|nr:DUF3991 and TOPRIM domain-containing protein [Bacillus sp. Au-Bac7]MCE4051667.1 DUF3991 domain-containing protein [Bacillus sp. Au-Bac7]